jgi:PAS domain S-box-containing protein
MTDRKSPSIKPVRTKTDLQRSELRYRRLFEAARDGILILDPDTRKITDANPFIAKLLGYSQKQLIKKELWQIGLLQDEAANRKAFRELEQRGFIRYDDLPLESKSGHRRDVEFVSNLYLEGGERVIQCNIRDITIRKQVEADLRLARLQLAQHAGQLERLVAKRTMELTATNLRLEASVVSIRKGHKEYRTLFLESQVMHKKLRHLTHQIISAQEEERKEISRELHDEVVQTLVGINVELSALGKGATVGVHTMKEKIAHTQRLVENSVNAVHRFARELRPAVLDDLGLIPALHAYSKSVAARRKIKIQMTAFGGVENLAGAKRTVLFRIAQEALTNVARHAHATEVKMSITQVSGAIRMEISDNGKSFHVGKALLAKNNKRLGLIGMKERIEMVGGHLTIESVAGKGTTVCAELPFIVEK